MKRFFFLFLIVLGCKDSAQLGSNESVKFSSVHEAINYLIINDTNQLIVNDTVIKKQTETDGIHFILYDSIGNPLGRYWPLESIKNVVMVKPDFEAINRPQLRINYGSAIFKKNCFACHTPYDFEKLDLPFDSLKIFKRMIFEEIQLNKIKYFYIEERRNEHWRYVMMDSINKVLLKEFFEVSKI